MSIQSTSKEFMFALDDLMAQLKNVADSSQGSIFAVSKITLCLAGSGSNPYENKATA